jgi:hypothetical protein
MLVLERLEDQLISHVVMLFPEQWLPTINENSNVQRS